MARAALVLTALLVVVLLPTPTDAHPQCGRGYAAPCPTPTPSPTLTPAPTAIATATPSVAATATATPRIAPPSTPTSTATATPSLAATPPPDTTFAPFDATMSSVLAQGGFPGGGLAVVRDGRLVYAKGYGYADRGAGIAYGPETLSRLASLSKPITLSKLRQMIGAGELSWATKVFPFLGVTPADARASLITVRELAEHTSGFGGDFFFESRQAATFYGVASPPDADTMIRWTAHYPLATDPGATYRYLNTNYAILSRVMERASGTPWIDLLRGMGACAGIARWRLGASLAQPTDEAHYDDPATVRSVFDSAPGIVPHPYGGYDVEAFAGAVALVSDVVDVARYGVAVETCIPRPEDDPIPTLPGYRYTYTYEGSLPGQLTFWLRKWDGAHLTQIVAFYDARTGGSFDGTIPDRLWSAAAHVAAWPSVDLFPQYP